VSKKQASWTMRYRLAHAIKTKVRLTYLISTASEGTRRKNHADLVTIPSLAEKEAGKRDRARGKRKLGFF